MKLFIIKSVLLLLSAGTVGSCAKTYTCNCSLSSSSTGQVKAFSKNKAQKRCSDNGGCGNGTITAN